MKTEPVPRDLYYVKARAVYQRAVVSPEGKMRMEFCLCHVMPNVLPDPGEPEPAQLIADALNAYYPPKEGDNASLP